MIPPPKSVEINTIPSNAQTPKKYITLIDGIAVTKNLVFGLLGI